MKLTLVHSSQGVGTIIGGKVDIFSGVDIGCGITGILQLTLMLLTGSDKSTINRMEQSERRKVLEIKGDGKK